MVVAIPILELAHVELFFDGVQRHSLFHHGADLPARKQQVVRQRVQILHIAQGAVRRDQDFRLEGAQNLQLLEHSPGGSVAVVGPDIGMALAIADEARMHHAAVRQPHRNVAGVMGIVHIDQFDGPAAEMKGQPIIEADGRVHGIDALERRCPFRKPPLPGPDRNWLHGGPVLGHPVVNDDGRGRRKQRGSAGMVAVILADDHVADRLRRHRLNECLQNSRLGRIVAGVDDHDALTRHDRHGVGIV